MCINEPCLKGRAYKRFGSFSGRQESPRAAREPGTPEGCSGGMLWRDAETPAVRGHKAGRTGFCSRPSGTQVLPSGRPRTCSFSRAGSLRARRLSQLHPQLSRPLPSPSRWGAAPATPAPGYPSLGFSPTLAGAPCLYGCRYGLGAPGGGGRRGSARLLPCGKPGSNRNHGVQSSERLRRLGASPRGTAPSVLRFYPRT